MTTLHLALQKATHWVNDHVDEHMNEWLSMTLQAVVSCGQGVAG